MKNKIFHKSGTHITYSIQSGKPPYVVFLHGLMSDMKGTKALAIEEHLKKREDDNETVLRERFKTYNELTAPILAYYTTQNLVVEIDGMLEIEQIHDKLPKIIHS